MIWFGADYSPPQIWAVEDTSLQVTWGQLPAGPVTASVLASTPARPQASGARSSASPSISEATIDHEGGAGAITVGGLAADTEVTVELRSAGDTAILTAKTLPTPPGAELTRFATISDLHLGARRWGAFNTIVDPSDYDVPHPFRCALAAVNDAVAWGAELLIIKGDAVQHEADGHFAQLADLVDRFPDLPMLLIPGNHEVDGKGGTIPLKIGERGLPYTRKVDHLDLPGIRIIVGDTTVPGNGRGSLDRIGGALIEDAAASDRPVFIGLHHQLQTGRVPRYWPMGIHAPQSTELLDNLDRLSQPVTVSSGHTHRNRSRFHGDVLVTEVGSTKDWPGVWAGYAVHDGGLRQVIRRSSAPDAISWTEYSRKAVGGLWSRWSPGPVDQRCVSQVWSRDRELTN
jgi:hypothetical protein